LRIATPPYFAMMCTYVHSERRSACKAKEDLYPQILPTRNRQKVLRQPSSYTKIPPTRHVIWRRLLMTWHSLPDCSAEECASSLEPRAAITRYRSEWATDMRIESGTPPRIGKGASDTWIHFTKETITVVCRRNLGIIYHKNIPYRKCVSAHCFTYLLRCVSSRHPHLACSRNNTNTWHNEKNPNNRHWETSSLLM
jgi:hypothetical protein